MSEGVLHFITWQLPVFVPHAFVPVTQGLLSQSPSGQPFTLSDNFSQQNAVSELNVQAWQVGTSAHQLAHSCRLAVGPLATLFPALMKYPGSILQAEMFLLDNFIFLGK